MSFVVFVVWFLTYSCLNEWSFLTVNFIVERCAVLIVGEPLLNIFRSFYLNLSDIGEKFLPTSTPEGKSLGSSILETQYGKRDGRGPCP